jgi:hypothetical protein
VGGGQGADYRQAGAVGQEGWPRNRGLFLDEFKRYVDLSKVGGSAPEGAVAIEVLKAIGGSPMSSGLRLRYALPCSGPGVLHKPN